MVNLYGYHSILLFFCLQVLKEKCCNTCIHMGNASKGLPGCCGLFQKAGEPAAGSQTQSSNLFRLIASAITSRQKTREPFVQYSSSHVPKGSWCWKRRSPMKMSSKGDHKEIRPDRPIHLQAASRFRCADTSPAAWQCAQLQSGSVELGAVIFPPAQAGS